MKIIPYGKQSIDENDISAVVEVLKSDFLTQGVKVNEFENSFAEYVNAKYAVAVSNGTAALHLAALALGVDSTTNVITTPITFSASANCIRYCGGNVYFVDIDPDTYLIDLNAVETLIQSKPSDFFSGIIPVDFAGMPVNMEAFRKLADKYGLWIIEDACHAPGAFFTDSKGIKQACGNSIYSDLTVFSFHPVKHITTGEGGMITTNDERIYAKLLKLRTHGITRESNNFQNTIDIAYGGAIGFDNYPGWYIEMQDLGYNYRLTDIQAALGTSQLKKADLWYERRNAIAKKYHERLAYNSKFSGCSDYIEGHAYHLFILLSNERNQLYKFLRENNVYTQIHYFPVHLMPYYQNLGYKMGDFPNAEDYYKKCMSLPMFPSLTDNEQEYVIDTLLSFSE